MSNIFDTVVFPRHQRNLFNLSHSNTLSLKFGQLIPFYVDEVIPGDTFKVQTDVFLRAMPMLAPLMHQVNVYTHYFFVPNRLVWDEWRDFITGGEDGTAAPEMPYYRIPALECVPGTIFDFLGFGCNNQTNSPSISCLPLRAYQLIWNEYYRDQNLQDEIEISKDSGEDRSEIGTYQILNRNWEKDYFTSALPWTQRGPAVATPFRTSAERIDVDNIFQRSPSSKIYSSNSGMDEDALWGNPLNVDEEGSLSTSITDVSSEKLSIDVTENIDGRIYTADIVDRLHMNINDLRTALATQRWLENNARGGSRYIEQIFSHFGVRSSDARLQRPEFLGGSIQPLSISEVLQTSASTENSDLGDMAGHGISVGRSKSFKRFFEEHGMIIGIMSVMPRTSYCQGTKKFLLKNDRFDFAFPEFANLGEQEVLTRELYDDGRLSTFGYQSRYAEYKYKPDEVHGVMKTDAFSPWTLVRKFNAIPNLNSSFIEVDSEAEELGRIFPVVDGDVHFISHINMNIKALRQLPKHVIPDI